MLTKKIIIGMFLSLSIAANSTHVGFTKKANTEPGMISIDLDAITMMHGIQFDLLFDSNEVAFDNAEITTSSQSIMFETREIEEGVIRGIAFSLAGDNVDGSLDFSFSPIAGFVGSTNIEFSDAVLADADGQSIPVTLGSYDMNFSNGLPASTALNSIYPNPFNPSTTVSYSIDTDSFVSISVFDASGREIAELVNGDQIAGYHDVVWNASSSASGVYFLKMVSGNDVFTNKLMLVK
mgnify:CR=1 FL=1